MSLITFLPLTYIVLHSTNNDKYLAFTFIMQTIAANMGGMITPYGNPQNLYLYSYYNIPTLEFFGVLLVQSITVAVLLYISCLFIKNEKLTLKDDEKIDIKKKEFLKHQPGHFKKYMGLFTLVNTAFLAVLIVVTVLT